MKALFLLIAWWSMNTGFGQPFYRKDTIPAYAEWLGSRNAQILGNKRLEKPLQEIYRQFLPHLMAFRAGKKSAFTVRRIRQQHRLYYRKIRRLLAGEGRLRFRRLVRKSGNILLI